MAPAAPVVALANGNHMQPKPMIVPSPTGGFMGVPRHVVPRPIPEAPKPAPKRVRPPRVYHTLEEISQTFKALWVLSLTTSEAITIEAWTVACWQQFPDEFSMAGYPQYPNTHRLRALASKLMHMGYVINANNKIVASNRGVSRIKQQRYRVMHALPIKITAIPTTKGTSNAR